MATQNVNLYVNGPWNPGDGLYPGRLLRSPISALSPLLPPINAGDIWNIKLYYYLGAGSPNNPFFNYRFPGSITEVRLRSGANNTIYATSLGVGAGTEIGPSVASSVTETQAGGNFAVEMQTVAFDSTGGAFKVTIPVPAAYTLSAPNGQDCYYCFGTTPSIPAGATAQQIQDAINSSLQWYKAQGSSSSHIAIGGPYNSTQVPASCLIQVDNWTQYRGFRIKYGVLNGGGLNNYLYVLPLAQLDDSGLQFTYGWNLTLNLDGNGHTFSDLFIAGNKPAYLEVAITQPGGSAQFASQTLLPSAGDAPAFTNGPPPAGNVNQAYSFTYQASGLPTFSLTAGALPTGLSLGPDGVISGTPTTPGTYVGTVTATNAYGSATQNFTFVINGNVIVSPNAGVFYDSDSSGGYADLRVAKPCSEFRFSEPDPEIPNGFVVRQSFTQLRTSFSPLAIGATISLIGQTWYLVQETESVDLGGGLIMWDRVYATVPSNYQKNVVVNKSYQWANYTFDDNFNPAHVVDETIASWTKAVTGVMYLEFYNGNYGLPNLPSAPFLQFWKFFNYQLITDMGSGFPTRFTHGNTVFDNNIAFSFVSATIEPYMGKIAVLKKIYA